MFADQLLRCKTERTFHSRPLWVQEEGRAELAVLTERAQGGASLSSGQLEVMLHRRTLFDDQRGVAEPLNETMQGCRDCPSAGLVARGRHWLTLQASSAADAAGFLSVGENRCSQIDH